MTPFDGLASRLVDTPLSSVAIVERTSDDTHTPAERTIVFVHGEVTAGPGWQEVMQDLPSDLRVVAVEARGGAEGDLAATLEALGIPIAHLAGWGAGADVVLRHALDRSALSLTIELPTEPVSPAALTALVGTPPVLWIAAPTDSAAPAAYRAIGGEVAQLAADGDVPHLDRPAEFRRALLAVIGYIGRPASPAPPTETIILSSSD